VSYLITGLKTHNADVVVPCHHLWNFDLLSHSLGTIEEHLGVEKHNQDLRQWQKRLWTQWNRTHANAGIQKLIDRVMQGPTKRLPKDKRYGI
jgi:lauroyl/myristoyl acyltransferase